MEHGPACSTWNTGTRYAEAAHAEWRDNEAASRFDGDEHTAGDHWAPIDFARRCGIAWPAEDAPCVQFVVLPAIPERAPFDVHAGDVVFVFKHGAAVVSDAGATWSLQPTSMRITVPKERLHTLARPLVDEARARECLSRARRCEGPPIEGSWEARYRLYGCYVEVGTPEAHLAAWTALERRRRSGAKLSFGEVKMQSHVGMLLFSELAHVLGGDAASLEEAIRHDV